METYYQHQRRVSNGPVFGRPIDLASSPRDGSLLYNAVVYRDVLKSEGRLEELGELERNLQ
jgi:hypothetical protein